MYSLQKRHVRKKFPQSVAKNKTGLCDRFDFLINCPKSLEVFNRHTEMLFDNRHCLPLSQMMTS